MWSSWRRASGHGSGAAPPRDPRHESGGEHGRRRVSPCSQGIRYRELVASSPVNSGRTSRSSLSGSWLIALCLCVMMSEHGFFRASASSSMSPFESETLSPRTVNTKYGSLRGLLVSFKARDVSSYSRSSGRKPSASSVASSSSSSSSSSAAAKHAPSPSSSSVASSAASNLRPVEVFVGVPYATPPIGSLRFMPPVTPTHWRGIRLANKFPAVCPQKLPDAEASGGRGSGGSSAPSIQSPTSSGRTSSKPAFSFTPNSYASMASLSPSSSSGAFSSSNQLPDSRISHLKRVSAFLRNQSEDCLYLNVYAPFSSPSSSSSSSPRK